MVSTIEATTYKKHQCNSVYVISLSVYEMRVYEEKKQIIASVELFTKKEQAVELY